jgi:hypothetical protein
MKTQLSAASVKDYLAAIPDEQMRADCAAIAKLMQAATTARPRMWGDKIVGFGTRKLRYANGKEIDWLVIAFAPRAKSIALYIGADVASYRALKKDLGKHTGGGTSCLHIRRLAEVDVPTLKKLIGASVAFLTRDAVRPARC